MRRCEWKKDSQTEIKLLKPLKRFASFYSGQTIKCTCNTNTLSLIRIPPIFRYHSITINSPSASYNPFLFTPPPVSFPLHLFTSPPLPPSSSSSLHTSDIPSTTLPLLLFFSLLPSISFPAFLTPTCCHLKPSLCLFVLFSNRWDGGAGGPVADWDLPQWEEWGNVQPAWRGQHGRCLLHAGHSNGPLHPHLHLWTSFLLETEILLHWRLLREAGFALHYQQGEQRKTFSSTRNLCRNFTCILMAGTWSVFAYWIGSVFCSVQQLMHSMDMDNESRLFNINNRTRDGNSLWCYWHLTSKADL